ncbi:MAG: nucleoside hydrolase [Candidatus Zipacnadales bacterium]
MKGYPAFFALAGAAMLSVSSAPQFESPLARAGLSPLPVLLSTDCGTEIDDQWAVIYLTTSPELNVLGFIGNHARNGLTGTKARELVLDVLENRLSRAEHPPVFAGSDGPLTAPDRPNDNPGVRFLIEQSQSFTPLNRLNVLIIGSHTDVASAILLEPSIVQRIRVIMMGFDGWPDGYDGWNIQNDLAAARVVFESGVPLVVGAGEICKRHLSFTTEECRELLRNTGPAGEWLAQCFAEYGGRLDLDGRKVWPIWDNITVAYLLGYSRTTVYHRPRIADNLAFDHTNPAGQLTWIEWLDRDRLWADFVAKLKAASAQR